MPLILLRLAAPINCARIEAAKVDPWGQRFDGHQPIAAVRALPAGLPEGQRPRVKAAGRIIQRRGQGKSYFLDIHDWTGRVQVMLGQKQVGEQGWIVAKNLDLGDLIGVEGEFHKTRMGEPTIFVDKLTMLGKSLQPHPDKWGGMQDVEFRLRHRYLDLIYNPDVLDRAAKRVKIIRRIRSYLEEQGYWEVDTPTLHSIAGGAAAKPFITHHNALDIDLFLRIALELHLKRLLVGGIEKVFEIGRVFRNEGIDAKHNPEFTMLELYQAYGNYETMMDLTEGLIVACVQMLGAGTVLPFGETTIDFTPPWQRVPYAGLFREHVGVDMDNIDGVRSQAVEAHIPLELKDAKAGTSAPKDHDVLVHELFEHKVEHKLVGPVFVYDYPAKLCPLTKRKAGSSQHCRALRALCPRDGARQRLHRAQRSGHARSDVSPAAGRFARGRVDGQDG